MRDNLAQLVGCWVWTTDPLSSERDHEKGKSLVAWMSASRYRQLFFVRASSHGRGRGGSGDVRDCESFELPVNCSNSKYCYHWLWNAIHYGHY